MNLFRAQLSTELTTEILKEPNTREGFIRSLIAEFGFSLRSIEHVVRGWNNHLAVVTLDQSKHPNSRTIAQAGVAALPSRAPEKLVVRVIKTEGGHDAKLRVQNEVAALAVVRNAKTLPVPEVYGWYAGHVGWILMEYKPGVTIESIWDQLSNDQQNGFIVSYVDLVQKLKAVPVPSGIGGFQFDQSSRVVPGPLPTNFGGPFPSLAIFLQTMFQYQLDLAEKNPIICGWRADDDGDIRGRLDTFLADAHGLQTVISQLTAKNVFIHGDLNFRNVLVDPVSLHITALLDFEFSRVGPEVEDYTDSFEDVKMNYQPLQSPKSAREVLVPTQDTAPITSIFVQEAKKVHLRLPKDVEGFEELAYFFSFSLELCDWIFEAATTSAGMEGKRAASRKRVSEALSLYNF